MTAKAIEYIEGTRHKIVWFKCLKKDVILKVMNDKEMIYAGINESRVKDHIINTNYKLSEVKDLPWLINRSICCNAAVQTVLCTWVSLLGCFCVAPPALIQVYACWVKPVSHAMKTTQTCLLSVPLVSAAKVNSTSDENVQTCLLINLRS